MTIKYISKYSNIYDIILRLYENRVIKIGVQSDLHKVFIFHKNEILNSDYSVRHRVFPTRQVFVVKTIRFPCHQRVKLFSMICSYTNQLFLYSH